jgi:hypothetical protein
MNLWKSALKIFSEKLKEYDNAILICGLKKLPQTIEEDQ